jgi:hypothetical protein
MCTHLSTTVEKNYLKTTRTLSHQTLETTKSQQTYLQWTLRETLFFIFDARALKKSHENAMERISFNSKNPRKKNKK